MNIEHAKELSDRLRRGNLPREHSIAHLRHASAHNGILKEEVVQVLVNHAVHPVEELPLASFFPNAACLSLNEVIIHGIPDETILQEGDILGVDLGSKLNGYFGDSARTLPVGKISKADEDLIACSKDTLEFAIKTIRVGMHFKELSFEIEKFIRARGFVPLYGFCGHGIGKHPHEEPEIPNYLEGNNPKSGPKIKNGMVFCIEPMICQKDGTPVIAEDKWSTRSKDGLRTSHYEHCMAVFDDKVEVLSIA